MKNYKPQSPLVVNGNGVFPLTTYDQIILENGSRWDGLGGTTHVGDEAPENDKMLLWVDTDEEQGAVMRMDSVMYIAFSIQTADWTLTEQGYEYQFIRSGVSEFHAVFNLTLDEESQSNQSGALNWETLNNKIILHTAELPGGTINGYMMLMPVTDRTEG